MEMKIYIVYGRIIPNVAGVFARAISNIEPTSSSVPPSSLFSSVRRQRTGQYIFVILFFGKRKIAEV
jgi:hypothetical protein